MTAATALSLVPAEEPIPSPVVPYVEMHPASVLLDTGLRKRFLTEIKEEISAFEPDLSTKSGRQEIASLAYKVARTKAPIEAAAKALNEDFNKRVKAVNAEKKSILEKLDALRDAARAPLDEWEKAESAREAAIKAQFDLIDAASRVLASDTSEDVKARITKVDAVPDDDTFHDARARALDILWAAYGRIVQAEADAAELAKLRAIQAERERQEAERARADAERLAAEAREREAAEQAKRELKEGHERAIASLNGIVSDACSPFNGSDLIKHISKSFEAMIEHKRNWQEYRERYEQAATEGRARIASRLAEVIADEEKRLLKAQEEAAAKAVAAARQAAEDAAAELRRAEATAAEEKRKADAEIARLAAEKQALERAESARIAEAKRIADEEADRQKNRTHRADVMTAAKVAIMRAGSIGEATAKEIVKAMVAGQIPHVSVNF